MLDAIITIPSAPVTTLSFDAQVYVGQNKVRRNTGRYTNFYIGTNVTDRALDLAPAATLTLTEPMAALVLKTDQPLTVTINSTIVLHVAKFLCLDIPITSLTILAVGTNVNNASVHLTYLS